MIILTLKEYLAQLEREELSRPENERRHVPNFSELGKMAGLTFKTISKLANNHSKSLNFTTGERIITALHQAGFSTELSDIITYQKEHRNESLQNYQ